MHPFMENEGDEGEDGRMKGAGEMGDIGSWKVSFVPPGKKRKYLVVVYPMMIIYLEFR